PFKEQKVQYNFLPSNRLKNVNYVETEYENKAEEQEEIVKEAKLKQSESKKEKALRTRAQQYQEPIIVVKEVPIDVKNSPLETFFSNEIYIATKEGIYYNLWENETSLTVCLVEAMGGIKHYNNVISYNIGHKITGQQKEEANNLLLGNYDVFATDISESGQTIELDDNISGNKETLSSNCEGDPIDKSIEGPVELLISSTCEVRESILVTKKVTLQEDNEKQYPVELIYQPWWLSALETPSTSSSAEFNNYFNQYLYNCVW
ncbi:36487_t:CDS:2, partial [Gigaspora margarita]